MYKKIDNWCAKLNSTIKIKSKTQMILSDLYYYNINGTIFNFYAMKLKYIRIYVYILLKDFLIPNNLNSSKMKLLCHNSYKDISN